jgi:opacity protein-like surface antigen
VGGFQTGYNKQFGTFVLGAESDLNLTSIDKSVGVVTLKLPWFGTTRARAGFLINPSLLLYGTGGVAYGRLEESTPVGSVKVGAWDGQPVPASNMHGPRHGPLGRNIFTLTLIILTSRVLMSGPRRTWAAQRSTTGSDSDSRSSGCCAIMAVGTVSSQRLFCEARWRAVGDRGAGVEWEGESHGGIAVYGGGWVVSKIALQTRTAAALGLFDYAKPRLEPGFVPFEFSDET